MIWAYGMLRNRQHTLIDNHSFQRIEIPSTTPCVCALCVLRISNCKRKRKDRTLYLNGTKTEFKRMEREREKKSLKKKQLNTKNMNSKWEKNVIGWPWPMDWKMMMVLMMMTVIDFGVRFFERSYVRAAAFHMALMWIVSACAHI